MSRINGQHAGAGHSSGFTLPRQVATRDCATVEKQPKMAMAKSVTCFTMVCAASDTGPRAAHPQAVSHCVSGAYVALTSGHVFALYALLHIDAGSWPVSLKGSLDQISVLRPAVTTCGQVDGYKEHCHRSSNH